MGCSSSNPVPFDSFSRLSSTLSIQTHINETEIDIPLYGFHEFNDITYLSSGSIGKVYSAHHTKLGKVALKFFGYTSHYPDLVNIHHELTFLSLLRGVEGVVQLHGYIFDSDEGFIEGKKYLEVYPILVMELLEGVELPKSVQNQRTEKYVSQVFRCLILALQGIHEHRYIHRDLKLENLMLVSNSREPKLKIIDFGSMVNLPLVLSTGKSKKSIDSSTSEIYRGCGIVGSPGMIAPETVMSYEYSFATDIWQAGCVLYSLLSGQHAFSPNRIDKIVNASYFPMSSAQWDAISTEAKSLVSLILAKNPSERLTISQILCHPWLTNHQIPQRDLGDEYSTRIKSLTVSRRIREVFMKQDNLLQTRREKLESIQRLMPSMNIKKLNQAPQLGIHNVCEENDRESCVSENLSASSPHSNVSIQQTIEDRVILLKKNIIDYLQNSYATKTKTLTLDGIIYEEDNCLSDTKSSALITPSTTKGRNGSISSETDDGSVLVSSLSGLSQPSHKSIVSEFSISPTTNQLTEISKSGILSSSFSNPLLSPRKYTSKTRFIDYSTYNKILCESGLESFATQEIFDLFDPLQNFKIDVLDVLFTFLLMYEELADCYTTNIEQNLNIDSPFESFVHPFDNSKLYFEMFDINHEGVIDAKSLKIILRCLLLEEKYLSHSHSTILKQAPSNHHILSAKHSSRSRPHSHIRHRSTSSEPPAVRMLSQQSSIFQQSFETVKTLRSSDYDDLFQVLDEEKNGCITYDQFKDFYDTLFHQSDNFPSSII